MNLAVRLFAVAVGFAVVASLAVAQGPGGPGGQGPGMRGMGQRGAFDGSGVILQLLRMQDVQKELKLTDSQIKQIEALQPSMGQRDPQQRGGQRDPQQWEQRQTQMREAAEKAKKLLNADQAKRLEQLSIQYRGPMALTTDTTLQKTLGITDAQVTKMQQASQSVFQDFRDEMSEMRGGDREEMQALMEDMQKALAKKIEAVLTKDQKAKYEAMKGKSFKFQQTGFGGFGFGGFGGGPGGPGGRGGGAGGGGAGR
jgi:hypothetical protein